MRKQSLPEFWREYLHSFSRPLPERIEDVRFVVLDTETTGLDQRTDEVLMIGAVSVCDSLIQVSDTFEAYFPLTVQQKTGSADLHGILPHLEQTTSREGVLPDFLKYLGPSVLVGHHLQFDVAMVNKMLKQAGVPRRLKNKQLDTANLAIRLDNPHGGGLVNRDAYGLDALCQRYDIPQHDRHHATGDAFITAVLLLKLLARLKRRGVVRTTQLFRR